MRVGWPWGSEAPTATPIIAVGAGPAGQCVPVQAIDVAATDVPLIISGFGWLIVLFVVRSWTDDEP